MVCVIFSLFVCVRDFYARSAIDLTTVLFSEVGCSWLLVNLLSNGLLTLEGKLQVFCGTYFGRFMYGTQVNQESSAAGSGFSRMEGSLVLGGTHKTSTELQEAQRLQQDKLMQRYGNYQSIPLGADDDAL